MSGPGRIYSGRALIIADEIHSSVHRSDLRSVAVEERGRDLAPLAKASGTVQAVLVRLAEARMRFIGIHVGVESVGFGPFQVPRGGRLLFNKPNPGNRFDALKAIFPGHHQADGGSI